jgi:hypothetical protein
MERHHWIIALSILSSILFCWGTYQRSLTLERKIKEVEVEKWKFIQMQARLQVLHGWCSQWDGVTDIDSAVKKAWAEYQAENERIEKKLGMQ